MFTLLLFSSCYILGTADFRLYVFCVRQYFSSALCEDVQTAAPARLGS